MVVLIPLLLYGIHATALTFAYVLLAGRTRKRQAAVTKRFRERTKEEVWPTVLTQIPVFNEGALAQRVISAAAKFDYPSDKHSIQVLDDSTDGSDVEVGLFIETLRTRGIRIEHVRRQHRDGFKAGALRDGLLGRQEEVIALFDADFVPHPDFLLNTIPLLMHDDDVGCVQARWAHLNRNDSWLTRAQSVAMDGFFSVSKGARAWSGLFMNFSGTAGIWRREAIDTAGGWQGDTLTEDLDLSYRAQLAGFKIAYTLDVACPGEVPNTPSALKAQQRRWAIGTSQTLRKLGPRVLFAGAPLHARLLAVFQLLQYFVAASFVLWIIAAPALALTRAPLPHSDFYAWLPAVAVLPTLSYLVGASQLGRTGEAFRTVPWTLLMGAGIALNNSLAALAGLARSRHEFERTPKTGSTDAVPRAPREATRSRILWPAEAAFAMYSSASAIVLVEAAPAVAAWMGFCALGQWLMLGRPPGARRRAASLTDSGAPSITRP